MTVIMHLCVHVVVSKKQSLIKLYFRNSRLYQISKSKLITKHIGIERTISYLGGQLSVVNRLLEMPKVQSDMESVNNNRQTHLINRL